MSNKSKAQNIRNALHTLVGVTTTSISMILRNAGKWMNNNPAHQIGPFKRVGTEPGPWRIFQYLAAAFSGLALLIDLKLLFDCAMDIYDAKKGSADRKAKWQAFKVQAARTAVSAVFFTGALLIAIGTGGSAVLLAATIGMGTAKLADTFINWRADKMADKANLRALIQKKIAYDEDIEDIEDIKDEQNLDKAFTNKDHNELRRLIKRCPTPSSNELTIMGITDIDINRKEKRAAYEDWINDYNEKKDFSGDNEKYKLDPAPDGMRGAVSTFFTTERLRKGRNFFMFCASCSILAALVFPPLFAGVGVLFALGFTCAMTEKYKGNHFSDNNLEEKEVEKEEEVVLLLDPDESPGPVHSPNYGSTGQIMKNGCAGRSINHEGEGSHHSEPVLKNYDLISNDEDVEGDEDDDTDTGHLEPRH